ncbi:MAG: ComEC/Rec2 family competence protein [Treponema sp.]|nr:ComEC/Rec2 family competence protein [Treponema sp.]
MAVIFEKLFRRPFLIAVIICVFVFYSGIFPLFTNLSNFGKSPVFFLFKKESISAVSGKIMSSPVKVSSGRYYSCNFSLSASADDCGAWADAGGTLTLMIPSSLVEALYPGGLFSGSSGSAMPPASAKGFPRSSFIFESGLCASFTGRLGRSGADCIFYAAECLQACWPETLWGTCMRFRALCRLYFKRMMFAWGSAGGLLLALLCGARDFTESETADAFRMAGLSHILALSGMHLSLFSGLAAFAGKKLKSIRLTNVLRISTICLFVWFAGFSPSLLRAFLSSLIAILSASLGILCGTADILCLSFLIQSAVCPSHIHNAAFLLSYGALAGITLFSSLIHRLLVKFLPQKISSSLAASASAQSLTAPLSLKLFGSFCPVGIFATCLISPLVTFFIYGGLVLIVLSLILPVLQAPSGIFMNFLYTVIKKSVLFFSRAPFLEV